MNDSVYCISKAKQRHLMNIDLAMSCLPYQIPSSPCSSMAITQCTRNNSNVKERNPMKIKTTKGNKEKDACNTRSRHETACIGRLERFKTKKE